jgi:thioredoxin-like negative regulator of GroEL
LTIARKQTRPADCGKIRASFGVEHFCARRRDGGMDAWKTELDAIVGARHGGRTDHVLPALKALDARFPHTPEIAAELAFTLVTRGDDAGALEAYERALVLGLPSPAEQSNALAGRAACHERARAQFPENAEFAAYLAVALKRAGRADEACALLLDTLLDLSEDVGLSAHQRALRFLMRG